MHIGGLGIYIVKESMDNVEYKYENNKNILILSKNV
jgi:anti-sigma regulatory factor (Ser/Thr protein kinase)